MLLLSHAVERCCCHLLLQAAAITFCCMLLLPFACSCCVFCSPVVFAIVHARDETTSFAIADAFTMANITKKISLSLPWLLPLPLLLFYQCQCHRLQKAICYCCSVLQFILCCKQLFIDIWSCMHALFVNVFAIVHTTSETTSFAISHA